MSDQNGTESKKKGLLARYFALSLNKRFLILFFGAVILFAIVGLVCGLIFANLPNDSFNWYGFIVGMAIVLCVIFGQYASTKQGYYTDLVFDYVIFAVPLAFLGGVLYYGFTKFGWFSQWDFAHLGIGVLGALIGAGLGLVIAKLIYAKFTPKKPRVALIQMLDLASVFFLMGQSIGRIGCYFGECCYGIAVDFDIFPFSYHVAGGLHLGNPFIESIWCAIGFIPMAIMYLSKRKCFNGFFISLYCIWYGAERLVLEAFRAPAQKLTIIGTDFGISQLVSILMIVFGVLWIAQYIIRAKMAGKKLMILVPRDKLSSDYFEYDKTIYAHPSVDGEGNPIEANAPDGSMDGDIRS